MDATASFLSTIDGLPLLLEQALPAVVNILAGFGTLILGFWLSGRAASFIRSQTAKLKRVDPTLTPILASIARYAGLILTFVVALGQFGIQTTSIIAVLGAAGLAIGLALQGTLSNVAAGIMLLLLRPFGVGDWIEAAGISEWFDELLSVDVLRCYKPTPVVYQLVTERFDCKPSDVTFFSSNNWDVSGAGAFGFRTIWVNRAGAAWDKLPNSPDKIVRTIAEETKSWAH